MSDYLELLEYTRTQVGLMCPVPDRRTIQSCCLPSHALRLTQLRRLLEASSQGSGLTIGRFEALDLTIPATNWFYYRR